jgi:carbamoyltransferase
LVRRPTILGINYVYHQPSACVVIDGIVVSALEEERINRVKGGKATHVDNTLVLPFRSIELVLKSAGIGIRDIDLIATSFSTDKRQGFAREWAKHSPVLEGEYETSEGDEAFRRLIKLGPDVLAARFGVPSSWVESRFHWIPHHIAHVASAFYPSSFREAAAIVIDGIGECETATLSDCTGESIEILDQTLYPNSLGFIWEVFTNFLGFESNQDESKIMGLAAYGNPDVFREPLRKFILFDELGHFTTHLDGGILKHNYSTIEDSFGMKRRLPYEPLAWQSRDRRHADLAAALQEATNEVIVRQAEALRLRTGRTHLVMAGGVCLNCVANGHTAEHCGYKDIYIQPAAGDAGTSIGAALHLHRLSSSASKAMTEPMPTPFLGPSFGDREIREALERYRLEYEELDDPAEHAAELLADGKIVGWFQGAMEFGPRALGNRSLLANPSLPGVRHILNLQVKHREEFRPFCPTILAEDASDWLEHSNPLCAASRVMLMTYTVKYAKRAQIPAVLHMDGSSRVQVLHREDNPLFHDLITGFKRRTGIPLVLNTSFNDREPIVCSPEDACKCYLKTRFDAMILGRLLVKGPKPWERDPELSFFEIESRRFDERVPAGSSPGET